MSGGLVARWLGRSVVVAFVDVLVCSAAAAEAILRVVVAVVVGAADC